MLCETVIRPLLATGFCYPLKNSYVIVDTSPCDGNGVDDGLLPGYGLLACRFSDPALMSGPSECGEDRRSRGKDG